MGSRLHRLAEDRHLARTAVIAVGAMWCLLPVLLADRVPEDAVPIVVAGDLIHDAPEQIYVDGGLTDLEPLTRERQCAFYDSQEACDPSATAFVSPPPAIPFAGIVASLPDDVGLGLIRVLASAAAVVALGLLWRDHGTGPGLAPGAVVLIAIELTPIVVYTVGLGQTSTLLLLAAVAGGPALAGRGWISMVAWGAVTGFKAFPGLAVVGVRGRRGIAAVAAVAAGLGVLTVVGALWAGWARLGEFVTATRSIAADARDAASSGGLETVARELVGRDLAPWIALGSRVVLGITLAVACRRVRDQHVTWAAALLFTVLVVPQVWTHYLIVVPGLGAAVASRAGVRALVVASLATLPAMVALVAGGLALSYAIAATLVLAVVGFGIWATMEAPNRELVQAGQPQTLRP